jgi:glyoxylase-like metal-dependent hydrolase (beta-lactamase superfamily II)/ferredoxin
MYRRNVAQRARAFADNAPGSFFVDRSCIDCETCYTLVPEVFADARGHSRVERQPATAAERWRAQMALVACPTASIGTDDKAGLSEAAGSFPVAVEGEVSFCGYTSEKSFGAWSYLVERPGGNVLVDSPRAAGPLLDGIEARGGVRYHFLTHRDDVADHAAFRRRFGCERVMHRDDGLSGLERYVEGEEAVALADDLLLIPTPGHTAGSTCLLYRDAFLFTGDHLWWNPERGMLSASKSVNWYSWDAQIRSLEKLLSFDFVHVLPGHGRGHRASSSAAMRRELRRAIAWLRKR